MFVIQKIAEIDKKNRTFANAARIGYHLCKSVRVISTGFYAI